MTKPGEMLLYVDRPTYEADCERLTLNPLPDTEAVKLAETGFERLYVLVTSGATMAEKSALATHLRRGWSLLSGRPDSTPVGTPL